MFLLIVLAALLQLAAGVGLAYVAGVLAIGGCGAAIAVLASGLSQPPADFTIPWAVIPIPGFLIGFWAAERYRGRFAGRDGWRGRLGTCGAPLAVAVVGVFVYRVLALWLPMPVSLAALPTLRTMGERRIPHAEGLAKAPNEPGLRRRSQLS